MLFRTQLSIICVESFLQNHNIFMIMVISGSHYKCGVCCINAGYRLGIRLTITVYNGSKIVDFFKFSAYYQYAYCDIDTVFALC